MFVRYGLACTVGMSKMTAWNGRYDVTCCYALALIRHRMPVHRSLRRGSSAQTSQEWAHFAVAGCAQCQAIMSQRAIRDFNSRNRDEQLPLMKKLRDLLRGHWSKSNAKELCGHSCRVPVYEIQASDLCESPFQLSRHCSFENACPSPILLIRFASGPE